MNLRTLFITVALLVALCAVVWFAQRPAAPASTDPRTGQPLLAPDLAAQAARVKLSDQGKTVELARQADGAWTVISYHDFPADFSKLTRLIADLTGAKVRRLVTARPDRLVRLEFKDAALSLQDAAGKDLWQVALGKTADGGGRYVRFGAEDKGYLADLTTWLDTESRNWADSTLLNLKPEEVASVEIGFSDPAQAPVALARAGKDEAWAPAPPTAAPEGQQLKSGFVSTLLSNLAGLRFTDTTATDDEKAIAARAHSRTVKLTTFGGQSYTITLSRKPEEKKAKPASPESASAKPPAAGGAAGGAAAGAATEIATASPAAPGDATDTKPAEPEFETIPAGPVFVQIASSDAASRLDAMMQKRAFQIGEWAYTALPEAPVDLWESKPAPSPAEAPSEPAEKPVQE